MSTAVVFNSEMKKYFASNSSEIGEFINEKFKKSNFANYNGFFDDFLFSYGIISFNSSPIMDDYKYIPYLNCTENNIFREKKGITELSSKPQTKKQCEKIFADYFKSKFDFLSLKTLTEWNNQN